MLAIADVHSVTLTMTLGTLFFMEFPLLVQIYFISSYGSISKRVSLLSRENNIGVLSFVLNDHGKNESK